MAKSTVLLVTMLTSMLVGHIIGEEAEPHVQEQVLSSSNFGVVPNEKFPLTDLTSYSKRNNRSTRALSCEKGGGDCMWDKRAVNRCKLVINTELTCRSNRKVCCIKVPPTTPTTAPPTTTTDTICENKQSDSLCQKWAGAGYCTTGIYVETVCMKTCNKCLPPTTPTTAPPTTTAHTCQCGLANTERIIGGVEVSPYRKYPWIVGLQEPSSNIIRCGGSIINDKWILTAAHCIVAGRTPPCNLKYGQDYPLNVVVGEHHRVDTNDNDHNTKKYKVENYYPHKFYNCRTISYDFALLELKERIAFTHAIRPICLPTDATDDYVGRIGIAIGWGLISNNGSGSDYLKEEQLPIFANNNCGNFSTRPSNQLCAGGEPGKAICDGDSGGPLAVLVGNRYIQVGIASYVTGKGCATTGFPNVFARVSKVLPWITRTTTNGKSCD